MSNRGIKVEVGLNEGMVNKVETLLYLPVVEGLSGMITKGLGVSWWVMRGGRSLFCSIWI